MPTKSRSLFWWSVWLSGLLAALMPAAPLMVCWVQEEVRSEASDPVEEDPTEVVDDVALSQSRSATRRTRRLESRAHSLSQPSMPTPFARSVTTPLGGQGSHVGRSPPLHC